IGSSNCVPNKNVKIVVLGRATRFIGDYEANTGALYSRKINLDGEQVSLQVQDTPCVSLQVGLSKHTMMCPKMAPDSLYSALLFTRSLCALVRRSALHCDLGCHLEHPGVSLV
uniref:Uncharacterized protein n=1 Tax=Oncorhynchus tshawytscha TaxID=74940 RepID=A0AAZ3QES6_ONCTS